MRIVGSRHWFVNPGGWALGEKIGRSSHYRGVEMLLRDVAADLNTLGTALKADIAAWGAAVIGVALVAMAIMYVLRLMRS